MALLGGGLPSTVVEANLDKLDASVRELTSAREVINQEPMVFVVLAHAPAWWLSRLNDTVDG